MRFVIKCVSEDGYDFPDIIDYTELFPGSSAISNLPNPKSVRVTLPWGIGTFTFGEYVVNVIFEYHSIDFGYTEPLIEQLSDSISKYTGKPTKWYQVPSRN